MFAVDIYDLMIMILSLNDYDSLTLFAVDTYDLMIMIMIIHTTRSCLKFKHFQRSHTQYSLTKCFPMFYFNFGSRKMFPVNEDYYLGWKHI